MYREKETAEFQDDDDEQTKGTSNNRKTPKTEGSEISLYRDI